MITEFPIPAAGSDVYSITAGPDGNLWFTEEIANNIGRITTTGVITEFPVPTVGSSPYEIASGPDGNLWFTEFSGNNLARITTSGVITEFPAPTSNSQPSGISTGPDGNLWFTEPAANKIVGVNIGVFPTSVTTTLNGSVTDDGLPVGATLTTNWSETTGPTSVLFSNPAASFSDVAAQVNPVVTSVIFSDPGTYILNLAGSDSLLNNSSSVTVTVNPPQAPTILSVSPNIGSQGQQSLSVNITGQFTHFAQGTTTASFGPGITVASLTVNSATTATVVLNISPAAIPDPRRVTFTTGAEMATLGNAFTVAGGCIVPPSGLVGWWPGNGNYQDIIGHNDGAPVGVVPFGTGEVGQGFNLNATSYVQVPNSSAIDLIGDLTIEGWIKPANSSRGFIVYKGDGSLQYTSAYSLRYGNVPGDQSLLLSVADGNTGSQASYFQSVAGVVPTGIFSHVAAVIQGTTAKIYVNGVQVSGQYQHGINLSVQPATQLTTDRFSDHGVLGIGNGRTNLEPFNGLIDEVSIYNRALSDSEIQAIFSAGSAGKCNPQPGTPSISALTPNSGHQGQQNLSVNITGQFTNFVQGTTTANFGAGITVNSTAVTDATHATANIGILANAAIGARTVTVTTGGEVASLSGGFSVTLPTVNQPPIVSAGPNQTITLPLAEVRFTEYLVPTGVSFPREIAAGSDGNLWFTENEGQNIGRIKTAGVITEFSVPTTNPATEGITMGPDGNVWFTEYSGQKIGRITPAGGITEFPLSGGSYPFGITTGPDGNLWFVERFANKIGRITPAGVITEFPIPTAGSEPFGIVAGPDGNLWFTEGAGHNVGRITTAGALVEFPIPTVSSGDGDPFRIAAGPDGNLWFTESGNNKIGRITPAGAITEFSVPTSGSTPREITTGPDGNLWFTDDSTNNTVGRITTAGVITEFSVPTAGSVPEGISIGPDGNLWFTEAVGNKIGKANFGVFFNSATTTLSGSLTDDGLPVGATLNTTWSETSGPSPVSFGNPTATFPDVAGQANAVSTSATFNTPGTYTLGLTASDTLLTNSASVTITIALPQVPTILSLNPNTGQQGQLSLSVNVIGQSTHFVQGTTTASFGAGITVASLTVNSATNATVVLNIDPAAIPGPRRVTFTTGTEMATLGNGFTVTELVPVITSVTPNVGLQSQPLPVTITGQFTNFVQGTTQASFGAGISVGGANEGAFGLITVNSATSAMAQLVINPAATVGPRTASIQTGSQQVILPDGFTVAPLTDPTWIRLSPLNPPLPAAAPGAYDSVTNRMIVFGGDTNDCCETNEVWVLTHANGLGGTPQWSKLAPVADPINGFPAPRQPWTAYDSPNNRLIIMDGCLGSCLPVATDQWVLSNANGLGGAPAWLKLSPTGGPPGQRVDQVMAYDPVTNSLIVFGGQNGCCANQQTYGDTWLLSNANGLGGTPVWTQLNPTGGPPPGQDGVAGVYDQVNNRLVVFGGWPNQSHTFTNAVWVLSNANGHGGTPVWSNLVPEGALGSPPGRRFAAAVYDPSSNSMTIFGGNDAASFLNDTWMLSNANGLGGTPVWTQLQPTGGPPSGRTYFAEVLDPVSHRMTIFGGGGPSGSFNDTWTLTGVTSSGTKGPSLLSIVPGSGQLGQTATVTLTGQQTHFVQGSSQVSFGSDITVNTVTVTSATTLAANITISLNANLGAHTVTATTGAEVASLSGGFTVTPPAANQPPIVSAGPNQAITLSSAPVTPDLVSWWRADGNFTDAVSNNNGTAEGSVNFVPGLHGQAFNFNRSGHVAVAHSQSLQPATLTAMLWYRINGYPGGSYVISQGATSCNAASYAIYTQGGGMSFYISDNAARFVLSPMSGAVFDGNWHLVAGTYDGNTIRFYVDGNEVGQGTSASFPIGYNSPDNDRFYIGAYEGSCQLEGIGDVDDVRIFKRALSASEIKNFYDLDRFSTTSLTGTVTDDGLPSGATLNTNWNLVSGPGPVSFSNPTSNFADVAGQSNSVSTAASFAVPGTYTLSLTGSDSQLSSTSNVTVAVASAPTGAAIVLVTPNLGQVGQQSLSVNISGQFTNFVQGTTIASFGAGITVANLTVNSATTATAVLSIDSAAAPGARTVTLTTGSEVASLVNGFSVTTVSTGPVLTQVSPNSGQQGQGGPIGVVGLNTHFVQGTTQLDFGPGITVSNINVTCPTCLTAQLALAANAPIGPRAVTATTASEVAQLTNGFTVLAGTPILTSMAPASGRQGQSVTSTITGQFTNWVQGTTTVNLGAGITVNTVNVTNPTTLTVQLTIISNASLGLRNLTVTTGAEIVSATNVFNVLAGLPAITLVNPNVGQQGQANINVSITGQFTNFVQGTTQLNFGAGITVNSVTVANATSLTANISIALAAAAGARTITATTGAETASLASGFAVTSAGAVILSVSANTGQQGQSGLVTVTGQATHFVQGITQVNFGTGITVSSVTVTNGTTLIAQIALANDASVGTRTVIVSTGTEVVSLANGFTVQAGSPFISVINPDSGQQGQALPVVITGQFTHFAQGTTTVNFGAGVTVNSVSVADATELTAQVSIAANATLGQNTVSVTTGAEVVTATNAFGITAASLTPVLSIVNPNTGQDGQTNLGIAITGLNTHFVQGTSQASFGGGGVTVNSVTVTDSTHLSVNISIAANAAAAPHSVVVTTGTEVATGANAFTVQPATNHSPAITIAPTWSVTLPSRLTINYTVTDDGLPLGGALTVSWDTITTPPGATVGYQNQTPTSISVGFDTPGAYTLRITATDTQYTVTQDVTVTVNPGTGGGSGPTVSITTPVDGAEVTTAVNVIGTVDSPSLSHWVLEFEGPGDTAFHTLATGTNTVANGALGTFDPSTLLNGIAYLRLTATDTSSQSATFGPISLVLTRNQKIGNFTVSFNDLSVPVAGLPIQIVRTYDSRRRGNPGPDFSYGWTLDVRGAQLAESAVLGDQWNETHPSGLSPYCISPVKAHILTATLPDGTTYQFQSTLTPQCQSFVPILQATFGFTPIGATPPNTSLAIFGGNNPVVVNGTLGPVTFLDEDGFSTFDPDQYILTLPDGRALQISRQFGLQKMTDLNGNTLTVTGAGIVHSSGKSVTFTRDVAQRITKVTDPAGNSINYTYNNLTGDLISVTDRSNNSTTFTYDTNHYLLTIKDPRGVQPIRNVYDNNGLLIQHIDAFGNTINYTHNTGTHQEIVTDRLGNVTVNEYDTDGNVVKVTDALGGITQRTYDSRDNLLTETNALGNTRTYTYDATNNRLTEADPLGATTKYVYNGRNQVTSITDALGRVTTNVYDANGNLTSTKDPVGNITTRVYNSAGLVTSVTDPNGGVTGYVYDVSGNLTQQTDALGNVTTYLYDANGNKKSETRTRTTTSGPETLVTSYQYDASNRLTQTTYPDGSTSQIQYNAIGKQSLTIDPLGHQTSYEYDLMGRLLKTNFPDATSESSTYDAEGDRIMSLDRASRGITYVYDQLKRLTQTIYPDTAMSATTYDAIGEVTAVKDPLGNATQYTYDVAGRRTKVTDALGHSTNFTYDAVGNQSSMTDANGNVSQYQYDSDNRRTQTIYPNTTNDSVAYDALGRTVSKTDQAGKTTQFQYDKLGRLTQVTDALSQLTQYTYDEVGNRLTQTDANGHTTTFAYDKLGRRTKRTLPLGMSETEAYDLAGNLKTKIDFNGKTTTFNYNAVNRLTSKVPDVSFGASTVSFAYTATGQRQVMTDASGTTNYTYDLRDRLTQKVTPEGTLAYTYDFAGNLTTIRSSNTGGTSVDYSYDFLNRLSTVKDNRLASGTTTYAYDNAGNLLNYLYPNGVQTGYIYNTLNRLTNVTIAKGGTLASYGYTLGQSGNRTQVTELGGRQVDYTYDALYRLKTETISGGGVNGTIGYQYDAVGNRQQRTSTVAPVPVATYSYDMNDRLTTDTYDLDGNTTASGGSTYSYDFENHLINQNSGTVELVYDGDGKRVSKTASGVTTKYLVDDRNLTGYPQVLEELSGGVVQRVYTHGLNRISQSQPSSTSFYGYDGHGNVRLLTDSTGAVTDRYEYDAFGVAIGQTGTTTNVYLYSGEQNEPNLGFYYLRARWLNAPAGRFVTTDQVDPIAELPESLNRFIYAFNQPVDLADPSGLWPTDIHNELLEGLNLPAEDINILKQVSEQQDSPFHLSPFLGGQNPELAYQHAMRDGTHNQSAETAHSLYDAFLDSNLRQAALYEAIGTPASHRVALQYIGKNLHALADSTSPTHNIAAPPSLSFEPWGSFGFDWYVHQRGEATINSALKGFTIKKLQDHYDQAFNRINLRTLILTTSVRSLTEQIQWNMLLPSQLSLALSLTALGLP